MDKLEITMRLLLEAINQNGLKRPQEDGEKYNIKTAHIIAEMFKIIYKTVDSCKPYDFTSNFSDLNNEELNEKINMLDNMLEKYRD